MFSRSGAHKMKKPKYADVPRADVLNDPCIVLARSIDLLKRTQALDFQLQRCFKLKSLLLTLWNDESIRAWRAVGADAGGMLQRSLIHEMLLLCAHLVDETRSSSSIVNCHKECFNPHLKSGPFKNFYAPLYQDLKANAKKIGSLRNSLIAHQDYEWLQGSLWKNLENDKNHEMDGSFVWSDLWDLMTLFTYYVNLCHLLLGTASHEFETLFTDIEGAEAIRGALIAAHSKP